MLLHSFAYNLVNLFRLQLPLSMRSAQIETLRTQLFKIGARIRETARCIRIHLASGWPFQELFQAASFCNSSPCFRPFDNIFGEGPGGAVSKNSPRSQGAARQTYMSIANRAKSLFASLEASCAKILASDELTRLGWRGANF